MRMCDGGGGNVDFLLDVLVALVGFALVVLVLGLVLMSVRVIGGGVLGGEVSHGGRDGGGGGGVGVRMRTPAKNGFGFMARNFAKREIEV